MGTDFLDQKTEARESVGDQKAGASSFVLRPSTKESPVMTLVVATRYSVVASS